jgi:hypothetical protein
VVPQDAPMHPNLPRRFVTKPLLLKRAIGLPEAAQELDSLEVPSGVGDTSIHAGLGGRSRHATRQGAGTPSMELDESGRQLYRGARRRRSASEWSFCEDCVHPITLETQLSS